MTDSPEGQDPGAREAPSGAPADALPIPIEAPPGAPDPALVAALGRDLGRGRRIVLLTWLVALFHAVAGLVSIRQAAMLVDLDRDLITTTSIEELGAALGPVRLGIVVVSGIGLLLAVRWLRGIVPTMESIAAAAIEGLARTEGSSWTRRLGVLLRPAGVRPELVSWAEIRVGSGRRLAIGAGASLLAATVVGLLATIGLATAGDLDAARLWRWVAGIDGALWVAATILVGAVVADIGWRAAVAGRSIGAFAPLSDAPGRVVVRLAPALLLFGGIAPILSTAPASPDVRCPGEALTCATVVVPVDHGAGPIQDAIAIVYGVHRAAAEPKGTLVVAVGGPGASGLEAADAMLEWWDPELVERFDIVFWDQRGVGESDGHDCPVAGGIYTTVEPSARSAEAFVTACLHEAEVGAIGLRRYATVQAAEDLESIRDHLGVDRFVLYGESYGTELAQVYALAHPERLSGLILDGTVDLGLSANEFWAAATRGFDETLSATFEACRADRACRRDIPDPAGAYDKLMGRLEAGDISASYVGFDGLTAPHTMTEAALEVTVSNLLYEPQGRADLLRALAASASGNDVPIVRLAEVFSSGFGGSSTFAYYAVMCADYRVSPTADTTDYEAVLETGRRAGALDRRTDDVYYAQVPCLYWPDQPAVDERPAPITNLEAPLFIIGATADPITPIDLGRAVAERAADAYRIETIGGPHVTFGRGYPCVDEVVVDFLLRDRLPDDQRVSCRDVVTAPYYPLVPDDADEFLDALDAMQALSDEMFSDPAYTYLGGLGNVMIGCRFGGTATMSFGADAVELAFDGCEYARGLAVDGRGDYEYASGDVSLNVSFDGGFLTYRYGDRRSVSGSFRGERVDIRE